MRVWKRIGQIWLVLLGTLLLLLLVSVAVNYRPGAVMGKRIDPGPIETLDGGSVRLSDQAGRVVLLSFGTNW